MKKTALTFTLLLFTAVAFAQSATRVIAHRGGMGEQDENTLSAFQNSWAAGVHGFETDVRLTKDGVPVIAHDSSLLRNCGVAKTVERLTAAELRRIKTKKGNAVLFLSELLEFFRGKTDAFVEFEMKTTETNLYSDEAIAGYCEKVYGMIKEAMPDRATWVMTSFDTRPLKYLHDHHPDAELQYITGDGCSDKIISRAKALGVQRIACQFDVSTRKSVRDAHKSGLRVNLWPSSKREHALLCLYMGADVICTDTPVDMKKYFESHPPVFPLRF